MKTIIFTVIFCSPAFAEVLLFESEGQADSIEWQISIQFDGDWKATWPYSENGGWTLYEPGTFTVLNLQVDGLNPDDLPHLKSYALAPEVSVNLWSAHPISGDSQIAITWPEESEYVHGSLLLDSDNGVFWSHGDDAFDNGLAYASETPGRHTWSVRPVSVPEPSAVTMFIVLITATLLWQYYLGRRGDQS